MARKKQQNSYQTADEWMGRQSGGSTPGSGGTQSYGGMQTADEWMGANAGAELNLKGQTALQASQLYQQLQDAAKVRARRKLGEYMGFGMAQIQSDINRQINTNKFQAGSTDQVNLAVSDYLSGKQVRTDTISKKADLEEERWRVKRDATYSPAGSDKQKAAQARLKEIDQELKALEIPDDPEKPTIDAKEWANQQDASAKTAGQEALWQQAARAQEQRDRAQANWDEAQSGAESGLPPLLSDKRRYDQAVDRYDELMGQLTGKNSTDKRKDELDKQKEQAEKQMQEALQEYENAKDAYYTVPDPKDEKKFYEGGGFEAVEAAMEAAREKYIAAQEKLAQIEDSTAVLKRDITLEERSNAALDYEAYRYRRDFNSTVEKAMRAGLDKQDDLLSRYLANQEALDASADSENPLQRWHWLSDNEIAMYYYVLGKQGQDEAEKYLDAISIQLDKRISDYTQALTEIQYGTAGTAGKIGMNALSVPASVAGGIASAVTDVGEALTGNFNPYSSGHSVSNYANTVRGVTARDITENVKDPFWQTVWQNTYYAGMSALDSAMGAALFGNGYTAIMGASSASQRARELYEDGASGAQIALGAVASGAIEMATEKYSIEYFTSHFLEGDIKGFADWMKKTLIQGVNEMSEEVASELANQAVDALLRGANSDNNQEIQALIAQGIPEEEAKRQALVNRAVDVFWAGYGGFVSGAAMGGVGGAINKGMQNAQYKADGAQIIQNEGIQALIDQAKGLDVNEKLLAIANDRATRTLEQLQSENLIRRGQTQKALGQLYAQVTRAQANGLEGTARADVRQAAEQALAGQVENPQAAAEAATKAAFGEALTEQEQQAVEAAGGENFVARLQDTAQNATDTWLRTVGLAAEEGSSLNPKTLAQQRGIVQEAAQEFSDPAAMVSAYRDGQDPALFIRGWKAAYANGRNGVAVKYSLDSRLTSRTGMTRGQIMAAHEAGRKAAGYGTQTQAAENTAAAGGVWQGQEWNDMRDPGRKNGAVAEGTGAGAADGQEAGSGADGAAAGGKVSARSLGIRNGTAEENLTVRPKEQYTEAEKAAAEVAAKHGLEITIVQGGSIKTVEQVDGKDVLTKSRALIVGDKMIVRSDDPLFSPAQIARHEAAHKQLENGKIDLGTAVRQLQQQYSTAQIREMIRLYTAAYGNTGMNARQVLEEMVCDAMGEMNAFATNETSSVAGEVGQFLRDLRKAAKNETLNSDNAVQDSSNEMMTSDNGMQDSGSETPTSDNGVQDSNNEAQAEGQKNSAPEDVKHSRELTTDGRVVAVVDEDILSNLDLDNWNQETKKAAKKAAAQALLEFKDGIEVEGITRKVNKTSRDEYTRSRDSARLARNNTSVFADKMRAASVADDIIIATTQWKRDGKLMHQRADNFADFDHGTVLIESKGRQYSAEVVVGITNEGEAVFYDVVDLSPTTFEIEKAESHSAASANEPLSAITGDSTPSNVAQQSENVKQKYSRELETVEELQRQNELLQEQRDYWRGQTEVTGRAATKWQIRALANQLMRRYHSQTEVDEIVPELEWLVKNVTKADWDISYADITNAAEAVAASVVGGSGANYNADQWGTGQEIKDFLRQNAIKADEALTGSFQNFSEFEQRNKMFKFNEKGKGTEIGKLWTELQNRFGMNLFPDSITSPGDQLRHIADTVSEMTAVSLENPYDLYMELTARQIANDVIAGATAISHRAPTKADQAVERATEELNRLLKAGRTRERARIEQSQQTTYRQQIKNVSEKFQRMLLRPGKGATQHAPANLVGAVRSFCELFNDSEMRRAARWQLTLEERSAALAEQAARDYVPKGAAEEARKIGTSQGRLDNMKARLADLKDAYDSLAKGDYQNAYDDTVKSMIDSMAGALAGKDIYQLDTGDLLKVKNTMTALLHTVSNANQAFSMGKDKTVSGMAQKMASEMRQVNHQMPGLKSMAGRYWMWQMTPDTFFNYVCGYIKNNEGQVIQKAFQRGSEKMFGVQREFYQMFQDYTEGSKETQKELKKLMNDPKKNMVSWGLKDRGGNEVQTSRGMMMQAYMLLRQHDSFESLQFGGFSLPNTEEYYKGNVRGAYGNMDESEMVSEPAGGSYDEISHAQKSIQAEIEALRQQMETLSPADAQALQERIDGLEQQRKENQKQLEDMAFAAAEKLGKLRQNIEEQLTPLEKQLIDRATEWYAHTGKLMKDVFLEMYGYAPNLVDNYVPIHRDPSTIKTDIRDMAGAEKAFNLENSSFTIDRVENYQPILLTDFFQELEGQKEKMSRYVGFAQVQKDFGKLWKTRIGSNGMTINKLVEAKFGSGRTKFGVSGTDFVEHYIADIAGGHSSEDILGDFYGRYAAATLRFNPRVAVSQAASIPTAASVVGWKSAAAGFAKGLPNAMSTKYRNDLAAKNVWFWQRYRGQGGSTELADIRQKGGVIEKIANSKVGKKLFNWCQTVDVFSTGSFMWCMAEDYVQRTQGLKPGMEGYESAVNETYTDIIRKSQPNYTTTERSDLLRDKRAHMKMLTMFKTQSSQNLNLLMEANGEFMRARLDLKNGRNGVTEADVKAARAKLANAATGVFLGGTVAFVGLRTIMNFIMGAVNPYRDEETDEVTLGGVIKGMSKEVLSSLAGTIALGGQVYDLVMSVVSGDKYYGMSDSALATITELVENSQKVIANALDADKEITSTQIWNMANSWCQALGIPASNAKKFYNMIDMYIRDIRNGTFGQYTSQYTSKNQYRARVAQGVIAGETGKADDALAMLFAQSTKDNDEDIQKDIAAGMREYLKDAYMTADVTDLEAERILEYTGTEDPAAVVARWDFMLEKPEVDNVSDNLVAAYNGRGDLDGDLVIAAYKYKGQHTKEEVVKYIQSLEITAAQKRALWDLVKGNWKGKDTPWG